MGYLVLARKYRPVDLGELVGQEHIGRALSNALAMQRIPHALLFCGARGTGKTSTARIVAKMLNCAAGPTDKPCGTCSSCKEIAAGTSIDVHELDAASNRGIDEVRELRSGISYAPARDRYKVYIVDEAHMLTEQAANAFLKTLEEPPPHVVFVLATTDPQKLPVTIRSRCQRYDFRRVKAQDVVKRLASICDSEGVAYDLDALYLVAREGDGSMRDSLSLLDQVIAFGGDKLETEAVAGLLGVADRGRMHMLLQSLVRREVTDALLALGAANDHGLDLRTLARSLAMEARDLLLVRLTGTAARQMIDRSDSEIDTLRTLAAGATDGDLERLSHVTLELAEQAAKARYPRLVLEMGVVRLCRAPALVDVAELAARVEAMLAAGPRLAGRPGGSSAPLVPSAGGSRPLPPGATPSRAAAPAPIASAWPPANVFPAPVSPATSKELLKPQVASQPAAAPAQIADADLPKLQLAMRVELGRVVESSLVEAMVVSRSQGTELLLGVSNEFTLSQCNRLETLDCLRAAAGLAFGGTWQITVGVDMRARTDSLQARTVRQKEADRTAAELELRNHSAVRAVVRALEGSVIAVSPAAVEIKEG